MGSGRRSNGGLCLLACLFVSSFRLAAQQDPLERAASLDEEHKCAEAERVYRELLKTGAPSSALLNNLGYHYLGCGSPDDARNEFETLLKRNPSHRNANLELARLAIERKQGAIALTYLAHIRAPDPEVLLVRAEALDQVGRHSAAGKLIADLFYTAESDPRVLFAIGITCGRIHLYGEAEKAFSAVLEKDPGDLDVLHNLGLASARAGDYDRARRAFETELKSRPQDVDALYELGRCEQGLHNYLRSLYLLAQARRLAPQRADIVLALARTAQLGGYYGDAIVAYDDYLKLQPEDDLVRRDRALVFGFSRGGLRQGLHDLREYVEKHPADGVGYYDLAQLSDRVDRADALRYVSRAVEIAPELEKARYYRAWLLEGLGRFDESATEAQRAVALAPADVRALDLLGLDYLNLSTPALAEKPLREAMALQPDDQDVLFHLSRALIETARAAEAKPYLKRFQEVKSRPSKFVSEQPGVIEAASLSSSERNKVVVEQLRQYVSSHPMEAAAKLSLASALLAAGQTDQGVAAFRELLEMKPEPDVLEQAGDVLVRFNQYALARQFLEPAAATRTSARLDLAVAVFAASGPAEALKILNAMPESQDTGDTLLLRARILDAMGRKEAADKLLTETLQHSISRPQLTVEAARLLLRHGRSEQALELTGVALRAVADDPDLLLMRVLALNAVGRNQDAETEVRQLERRWPEWDRPYLLDAVLSSGKAASLQAKEKLQIAAALGLDSQTADCALRAIESGSAMCTCEDADLSILYRCDGRT